MKANTTQVLKEDREKKRRAAAGATIGIELEEKLEVPERKCSKIWIRSSLEFTGELSIAMHWKSYIYTHAYNYIHTYYYVFIIQRLGFCLCRFFSVWWPTPYLPLSSTTAMFDFDVCLVSFLKILMLNVFVFGNGNV